MKMSELSAFVDELRAQRAALHEELHVLLQNDDIKAGEARSQEAKIRAAIKAINGQCYPAEVVRSKLPAILKGKKLSAENQEIFDRCIALVKEAHGEIEVG